MTDDLSLTSTAIPGLLQLTLPLHRDSRGWFKENWQRAKMLELGLPDFGPVQNNISFNESRGTTRGLHAEPWDKYVSLASGRIFGAWVDLRAGDGFGVVVTAELGPGDGMFVPRGVANSFQTLEDGTAYSYLVNDHWRADAEYVLVALDDPELGIDWPVSLADADVSEKDRAHPRLADVRPIAADDTLDTRRTLILGAGGQVGRELARQLPQAVAWTRADYDLANLDSPSTVDWSQFSTVINAAAYTKVDEAETWSGRRDAWRTNVHGVVGLARAAIAHDLTLVHVSSDYVFDGTTEVHPPSEPFSPLGVYGQTKAAGDAVVMTVPRHLVIRTSWVVGDGPNFVRTMERLARTGVDPQVVDDQVGALTHTDHLAREIVRLTAAGDFGTHHVTSDRSSRTWFEIAQDVFRGLGEDPSRVTPVSTAAYGAGKDLAPRPMFSTLGPSD